MATFRILGYCEMNYVIVWSLVETYFNSMECLLRHAFLWGQSIGDYIENVEAERGTTIFLLLYQITNTISFELVIPDCLYESFCIINSWEVNPSKQKRPLFLLAFSCGIRNRNWKKLVLMYLFVFMNLLF